MLGVAIDESDKLKQWALQKLVRSPSRAAVGRRQSAGQLRAIFAAVVVDGADLISSVRHFASKIRQTTLEIRRRPARPPQDGSVLSTNDHDETTKRRWSRVRQEEGDEDGATITSRAQSLSLSIIESCLSDEPKEEGADLL